MFVVNIAIGDDSCDEVWYTSDFNSIFCTGENSCYRMYDITNVENIYAFAEWSFDDSNVTSAGNGSNLNIYIDTDHRPTNLRIYCQPGDTCTVYCFEPSLRCARDIQFFGCDEEGTTCNTTQYKYFPPTTEPTALPTISPTVDPTMSPTEVSDITIEVVLEGSFAFDEDSTTAQRIAIAEV